MEDISLIDEAILRTDFRKMRKDIGSYESLQCLYTMLRSAEILSEVLIEELDEEIKKEKGLDA